MNKNEFWLISAAFLIVGFVIGATADRFVHRHDVSIYESNIGGFILRDGKIFSVYEMQRNINGDMVGR